MGIVLKTSVGGRWSEIIAFLTLRALIPHMSTMLGGRVRVRVGIREQRKNKERTKKIKGTLMANLDIPD